MTDEVKLTQAQMKILRFIAGGFEASRGKGSAVMVDKRKICNIDTMTSLTKKGVLTSTDNGWILTQNGSAIAKKLFP
jgi:hypothetical protein